MDVSIIIVNYNTVKLLIDAINSVFEKTEGIEYEIIVVDNNSPDNPKNILAEKYGNKIIYLGLSENIGFGRANNEAAKIAQGRNLFFLNPDTILLNNAVKILSDYLDDNPPVGCCGGNLYNDRYEPTVSFSRILPSILDEINQLFLNIIGKIAFGRNQFFNYTNKVLKVAGLIGADLMIRKGLFDSLKGFDPDFFMFAEEIELEYRIGKKGYKIISVPYARIIHLEGQSILNRLDRMKKLYNSRLILLRKMHNPISIMLINALSDFNIELHLFAWILLRNEEKVTSWLEFYKLKHMV